MLIFRGVAQKIATFPSLKSLHGNLPSINGGWHTLHETHSSPMKIGAREATFLFWDGSFSGATFIFTSFTNPGNFQKKRISLLHSTFWCEIVANVRCDIAGNTHPPVFSGPGNVRIQEHNPQA